MKRFSFQTKAVALNTFSQILVRFFSSFSTLFVTLLISYFLGTEFFGSFVKVTTFVSFFYLITDFGINGIFIKDNKESDFGNFLLLRFLISVFLILFVVIVAFLLPYNSKASTGFPEIEKIGIILYSLTITTQAMFFTINAMLQKNKEYKKLILPSFVSSIFLLLFVSLGVYYKNLPFIFLSYFFSGILFLFFIFQKIKKNIKIKIAISNFFNFSKIILKASFPLALMLFFNLVYAKADILILSLLKPTIDVGTYGFSYRFFEFVIAVPVFLSNSIYPILLEKRADKKNFFNIVNKYSFIIFSFSILFTILLFISSPLLGVVKQSFAASILPLQILSLSLPFFFLTSILQWVLIIENKKMFLVALYIFSMILNIILNLMFIPHYSYIASSVITVICEGLVFALMFFYLLFLQKKIIRI